MVWHDAPLRVFLLQRVGTLHTLYLFQKYDIATACCAGAPDDLHRCQSKPIRRCAGATSRNDWPAGAIPHGERRGLRMATGTRSKACDTRNGCVRLLAHFVLVLG